MADRATLSGRRVVVTGGTGALGSAVVGALLAEGAACVVPCHHASELERFPYRGDPRVTVIEGVDLTDEASVVGVYERAGALWASVHLAGGFAMGPVEGVTKAAFVGMMQMNALTCFLCSREAVKALRRAGKQGGGEGEGRRGGRIVNVAARPALEPRIGGGMVAYTASKAAVAAMTQAMGEELAAEGILVNAVAPSIMDTPANRKAMPGADHSAWAKVEEVAAAVIFLASPSNRCVRSGVVPVYGGA